MTKNELERKYGSQEVFKDFLRYIVRGFTLEDKAPFNWQYDKDETITFYNMLRDLSHEYQNHIEKDTDWYDAVGNEYEIIAGLKRKQNNGQFFTPESLCDLISTMCYGEENKGGNVKIVSDPACGSGRNLLAYHSKNIKSYCIGEDIDYSCCLMTVVNFLFHGVVGEVLWHNTLTQPNAFIRGWKVNAHLNDKTHSLNGLPHIEIMSKEDCNKVVTVCNGLQTEKKSNGKKINTTIKQLNLF